MKNSTSNEINIKRIFIFCIVGYMLFVICFFFLAGDQIRYRESRNELKLPVANSATTELAQGVVVEQSFNTKIQRLESVSVQWGNYHRANTGTVTIDLIRKQDNLVLMHGIFDAAAIEESEILSVFAEKPVEMLYEEPLMIRLSSDSPIGEAVAPLTSTQGDESGFALTVNGELVPGMLCFAASGTDYIWTGVHYWQISALLGMALVSLLLFVWLRYRSGKRSYVINALIALNKYRFLIRQLVGRDFKIKYKRSILGVFWSFLNPLLMMLVQYFVFSTIFRSDVPYFAAYLIIGTVMFNFFTESCGMTLGSILGNAGLITKVYIPKYIYPLTRTISSVVNLVISLIPLIIVCLITGVHFHKSSVLALFFFFCLIIFCLGFGMLLATSMVFFRDTQFLWSVLSMMWMYATPIFYPETILPDSLKFVFLVNPIYHFLSNARLCILGGLSPEPIAYFQSLMIALGMLLVGAIVFYKKQDRFVLYL